MSTASLQTAARRPLGRAHVLMAILTVLLSSLLVYNLVDYAKQKSAVLEGAKRRSLASTQSAAAKIDDGFARLRQIADQQVREIERSQLSRQELEDRLNAVMEKNPEVFGFSVAYKPYKYEVDTRLYGPYCDRHDGEIRRMQIQDVYDYTQEDTAGLYWYIKPLQDGAGWTEPFFGSASSNFQAVYSVPFYGTAADTGQREIVGVLSVVYALDDIAEHIRALDFGGRGYAYLLSRDGTYLSHPTRENVTQQKRFGSASEGITPELTERLQSHQGVIYDFTNSFTGQASWVVHQAVPSTDYTLGAVFIQNAMTRDMDFVRHKLIVITMLVVSILALLSILATRNSRCEEQRLWGISIFISLLLVLAIGAVWFISTNYSAYSDAELVIVTDQASVQSLINERSVTAAGVPAKPPILIPTGVYIQSLEFDDDDDVTLTGYVWQTYSDAIPETIARGVVFPEAVASTIEEAYIRPAPDGETIGWHFSATLRQWFDYSKYPLDSKDVWLRLWPKDFDKNIVLVPDFGAYRMTNPDYLPGIDSYIILSGWDIKQSFFCYYTEGSYNTNFGIQDYVGHDSFPELAFMALVTRKFMNPFIAYLLPFVVMAFMLFGTLILIYVLEAKAEKFDFSAAGVLAACTGLFFSVVLTHNGLRESIASNGILYLEYFYFILYAAIIVVIVDAFLVALNSRSRLVQYRDNILPKVLYWPTMLTILLAITLRIFY